jgi:anti-sigma B factor antagonist
MPFIIKGRNVGPVTILELGTRLTSEEGSELKETVNALLAQGRSAILLDCVRLGFMDSQGIAALVRTWISAGRGGNLRLFSLTPRVKEVLEITGLLKIFDCYDDVGAALRSSSHDM